MQWVCPFNHSSMTYPSITPRAVCVFHKGDTRVYTPGRPSLRTGTVGSRVATDAHVHVLYSVLHTYTLYFSMYMYMTLYIYTGVITVYLILIVHPRLIIKCGPFSEEVTRTSSTGTDNS